MADKIDPYDVGALGKAVNEAATRVSAVWISYLIFGLYLVVAAGNTTHRQLFLAEPIRLPVLNVDLPLVGFFVLAPVLFVILHVYVLTQIVFLARTAATFNDAVKRATNNETYRAHIHQRIANTIFAQIFAGTSRERDGILDGILLLTAWLTLAIGPAAVLFVFNIKFLPYHSAWISWCHRILIAADLAAVLLLWSGALNPRLDINWSALRRYWKASLASLLLVLANAMLVTFPGEFHATWTRYAAIGDGWNSPECSAASPITHLARNFDRLSVPREDFVDDDKLGKIIAASNSKAARPWEGERTNSFRYRNLECANFEQTDLRRSDFTGSELGGASLARAELQGSSFSDIRGPGADFTSAKLQDSIFWRADLQTANLFNANLRNVDFHGAKMQGASLEFAHAEGAIFTDADIRGGSFGGAKLIGASFTGDEFGPGNPPELQATDFSSALLQGANFTLANLQASNFSGANLKAVNLTYAQLQGTQFENATLDMTIFHKSALWKATDANCTNSLVITPRLYAAPIIVNFDEHNKRKAQPQFLAVDEFIDSTVSKAPKSTQRNIRKKLEERLKKVSGQSDNKNNWQNCAANPPPEGAYKQKLSAYLLDLACKSGPSQKYVAIGINSNFFISEHFDRKLLTRRLLGLDGNEACLELAELDEWRKRILQPIDAYGE